MLPCDALEAAAQTHLQKQQARKQEPESVPKLVQERERPTEMAQQALEPVQVRGQVQVREPVQVRESVREMEPGSEMEPPVKRLESEVPPQDAPQGN